MATYDPRPADGLNDLSNGKLTRSNLAILRFSAGACAYRGSLQCLRCPWARRVPVECGYKCCRCPWRSLCPCGHEYQTVRVEAHFRIGAFAEVKRMDNQNVGSLRRFEVRGQVFLSWYCDCPDCHSAHGRTFRVEATVLDRDEERATAQAVRALGYDYEQLEWEDGPDVVELPLGEDERMRMLGAPELLAV